MTVTKLKLLEELKVIHENLTKVKIKNKEYNPKLQNISVIIPI